MASVSYLQSEGKPRSARISDRGCITCPPSHGFTADSAINTLERLTNNVLIEGWRDLKTPTFPLNDLPIKAASSQQMSGNSRVKHTAFYPDDANSVFHDPTPEVGTYTMTRELLGKCGDDLATATFIANHNNIGCAPPRGERGISGKRRYYQSACTTVKEIGPFCVTSFFDLQDFRGALSAYKAAAIKSSAISLSYEKIRRFVGMSYKNGSAIAGQTVARLIPGDYDAVPTSSGSFDWLINSIQAGLGAEIDPQAPVTARISPRLYKHMVLQYLRDSGVDLTANWQDAKMQAQGFNGSFAEGGINLRCFSTGRKIFITSEGTTPVYVEVYDKGAGPEWSFQNFYRTEVGDDPEVGQATGFFQTFNPDYGNADAHSRCNGVGRVLCEQILIHTGNAFHYEAFPTNPLGERISGVETNANNLWGSTGIIWHTGPAVDMYYLNHINKQLGDGTCYNNSDNTWFAGRIKTGMVVVEDEPREMMSLLVRVPYDSKPIEKTVITMSPEPPAPIIVTARKPKSPAICFPVQEATEEEAPIGCMLVPPRLTYNLPAAGSYTASMTFMRDGGSQGALLIPYTVTSGTAGPLHYTLQDGNIAFLDGEETATIEIELHSAERATDGPPHVRATLNLTDSPVLCGDRTEIQLCFRLCEPPVADEPC